MKTTGETMTCQTCDGQSSNEGWKGGCRGCGGYGFVAEKVICQCGRQAWMRPGVGTAYDGKIFYSLDALGFVWHMHKETMCVYCEKKNDGCSDNIG